MKAISIRKLLKVKEELLSTGLFKDVSGMADDFSPFNLVDLRTLDDLFDVVIAFNNADDPEEMAIVWYRHTYKPLIGELKFWDVFDSMNQKYKEKLSYHLDLFY